MGSASHLYFRPIPICRAKDTVSLWSVQPSVWEGQVVGAVGVSGVKSTQDAEIATAGIDAVLQQLAAKE